MLQPRWWWFMPRLRLWPNGSVRPDAKPWANKDVFACFANASGINTHQFHPNPNPLLQPPSALDDGFGTCLICNQKRKFVTATACPLSMFQSARPRSTQSAMSPCLSVCPRLCVVLSVSLSMLLSVSGSFALTMSAFPFCLCCCSPLLLVELLLFASVSEARSSRSFAALQAHLHLHIVLVPPGTGGKGIRVGKLCHRLRTGCA